MIKTIRKENSIISLANNMFIDLPSPSNFNYLYNFGSLLGICLIIQVITGVFLAMHYCADVNMAFTSVVHITGDVITGLF